MIPLNITKIIYLIYFISKSSWASPLLSEFSVDTRKELSKTKTMLTSGKKGDFRFYRAEFKRDFDLNISQATKIALNYKLRCNNDFRKLRTLTPKDYSCPYPSKSIIENQVIPSSTQLESDKNEVQRFLVQTRMKNRGYHSHVDLVRLFRISSENYYSTQEMLTDEEAKKYIKNPLTRQSVFKKARVVFTFKKLKPNKTQIHYRYTSITDHWLLNKSLLTSQVFNSIENSIGRVLKTIEEEAEKVKN